MVLHTLIQSNRLFLRLDDRPQDPDRVLVVKNRGLFQRSQCELLNKLCRVLCDAGLEILSADVGQYPPDSESSKRRASRRFCVNSVELVKPEDVRTAQNGGDQTIHRGVAELVVVEKISENEHANEFGQLLVRVFGVDVEARSVDPLGIHLELLRRALRRADDLLSSTRPELGARGFEVL